MRILPAGIRSIGKAAHNNAGCGVVLVCFSLLTACGSDEAMQAQQPDAEASGAAAPAQGQPQSGQTQAEQAPSQGDDAAAPSPLLDQPKASPPASQSPADLPPITASIPADMSNRINVTVHDPLPVSAARLIDPQGHATVATRIDHDRISYKGGGNGWPHFGFGISGGSSSGVSTGFGIGFPLFPQTSEAAGSINESHFSFTIPDVAAYNANWQHWKIHIDLSDGVNTRGFETLPPAPPHD